MNDDKVTISKYEFWSLRNSHERLAISSDDVKEMVLCAQERMKHITSTVTVGGREGRLPYPDDNEHMFAALRLLSAAKDAEHAIARANRINQDKV
mgnify:CR=1 FL=1|tara:strand:+ start:58 stop:342 length:285 start_codon:yes stop_codon:yes gene_type:complete